MKIIKFHLCVLFIGLLIGCSASPAQTRLQGTLTSQTEAFLPTLTPLLPGTSSSPNPLANKFIIQIHCPAENLGIHEFPNLPGTLVFSADSRLKSNNLLSPEPGKNPMISFWHPQSDRISSYRLTEGQEYYYYVESPNKEKLAFAEGKTISISFDLIVLDHRGKELGKMVVPDDWIFFHWRNNDQLLLHRFSANDKYDLVAINLENQEQQNLSTNFPNIYQYELFWNWGSQTLFNPEATMVLYPVRQSDPSKLFTVLWNVKENKEVARIAGGGWARWSPDGSRFLLETDVENSLLENRNEILLVNTSGEKSRATFFTEYYDKVWIEQPVWSPDSRYIAFWLITTGYPFETAKLGVLDTETVKVDLLCKDINPRPFRFGDPYELGYAEIQVNSAVPIWSPDSNYLLIEDHDDFGSNTYLYDLRKDTITKIADQARPVSWLK